MSKITPPPFADVPKIEQGGGATLKFVCFSLLMSKKRVNPRRRQYMGLNLGLILRLTLAKAGQPEIPSPPFAAEPTRDK